MAYFAIGTAPNQAIGLASIANGRITRRLEGAASGAISSFAAFPDSQTIYYTASRSVWSIPAAGGEPKRLGAGDSVTVDPVHHELIVRLDEKDGVSLVRMPPTSATVRPIPLAGDVHLVSGGGSLSPTAVGKDGLILVQATTGSMWTWPVGLLNPETGNVQILKFGYPADMPSPGWSPDGKVVVMAEPIRSSLWRFHAYRRGGSAARKNGSFESVFLKHMCETIGASGRRHICEPMGRKFESLATLTKPV